MVLLNTQNCTRQWLSLKRNDGRSAYPGKTHCHRQRPELLEFGKVEGLGFRV